MKKTKPQYSRRLLILIAAASVATCFVLVALNLRSQSLGYQIKATENKSLIELTKNIKGELLAVTGGKQCERGGNQGKCYQMQTAILLVENPPDKNYVQIVDNLNQYGWTSDGKKIDLLTQKHYDSGAASEKSPGISASLYGLALLSPAFFGERIFLVKGDNVASVFVATNEQSISESDLLYVLNAEIPSAENFDFENKVVVPLKNSTNKIVLAISASE